MAQHLSLTDNNTNNPPKIAALSSSGEEAIHVYEDLQAVAGIPLESLCKDNPSLLVFPHCLGEHQDGIERLRIFHLRGATYFRRNPPLSQRRRNYKNLKRGEENFGSSLCREGEAACLGGGR